MEQGPTEKKIIEMSQREGLPLPKAIANAPDIPLGLEFYWLAFLDLNSCRAPMGGQIPWTAIHDYGLACDLDEEQTIDLKYHVRALDNHFIDFHEKKSKKVGKKEGRGIGQQRDLRSETKS